MNHIKLNDDYRRMLLESAFWGKAGIDSPAPESADMVNESTEEESQEEGTEEQEEAHVCPLCTSMLEAPIDAERVVEHLEIVAHVLDRLDQINESELDIDQVIAEAIQTVLLQDEESDEKGDEFISEEETDEEELTEEESEEEECEEEVVEEAYGKKASKKMKAMKGMDPGYKAASKKGKMPKSC
jgi:hypothetical protein